MLTEINLSKLSAQDTVELTRLHACLTSQGFLQLTHHSLDAHDLFSRAERFFDSPPALKEPFSYIPALNSGWIKEREEMLHDDFDTKEAWNCRTDLIASQPLPPSFDRALIHDFSHECHRVCLTLLTAMARCLDLPSDFFTQLHRWEEKSGTVLRTLYYPPCLAAATRCGAHSDFGSLTLLFLQASDPGGLEILLGGSFAPVVNPSSAATVVVNVGDIMEYWTQGLYPSTVHRVSSVASGVGRFSIAYFCHAEDAAALRPIPLPREEVEGKVRGEGAFQDAARVLAKVGGRKPETAGEHLQMRLAMSR